MIQVEAIASIGQVQLAYCRQGQAPQALLWLHGGFVSMRTWDEPWAALVADGLSMLAVDLCGHGRSSRREGPTSVSLMAADVLGLLDRLGVEQVVICGHSLGGMVAQELTLMAPDRVLGLILVDTTFNTSDTKLEALQSVAARVAFRFLSVERVIEMTARELSVYRPDVAAHVRQEMASFARDPAHYQRIWQAVFDFDVRAELSQLRCPMLILAAASNPGTSRQALVFERECPQAHVILLPKCGHMIHWDQPELFLHAAREFLAQWPSLNEH